MAYGTDSPDLIGNSGTRIYVEGALTISSCGGSTRARRAVTTS
jgi:hypothetical protein